MKLEKRIRQDLILAGIQLELVKTIIIVCLSDVEQSDERDFPFTHVGKVTAQAYHNSFINFVSKQ